MKTSLVMRKVEEGEENRKICGKKKRMRGMKTSYKKMVRGRGKEEKKKKSRNCMKAFFLVWELGP